jgi:tRNA A-37 threonylcarbamoyl transferase component Bud32
VSRAPARFGTTSPTNDATTLELREAVGRTRTILGVGTVLWALGAISDVVVGATGNAPLSVLLAVRFGFLAIAVGVYARLRMPPLPSDRAFEALSGALYFAATFALGIYAIAWGGIASPAGHGVAAVLCVRAVGRPLPLRRGLVGLVVTGLGYLAALGLGAIVSPELRAQFEEPSALGALGMQSVLTLATAGILAVGGDTTWMLKQRLFATRVVGRYRLDEKLGEGGMGEVWRAYHPALRKHVAVKILRGDLAKGAALSRFDREIDAMTELSHPHTVRVFDAGQTDDGLYYYAMELLTGRTLGELVRREGPLPPERAVRLVRQAARAIAEAHEKGLIHRDIKPENLFVCDLGGEEDFIKVLDFGIAKLLDAESDATLTREGMVVGTPAFMAPEQCLGRSVDARSDVYALGAVLFHALTGSAPFGEQPVARVLSAHVSDPVPDVSLAMPWVCPAALGGIVQRALAKDPAARMGSMTELDAALGALGDLGELELRVAPVAPVSASAETLAGD